MRVPDLALLVAPEAAPTFREISARWLESRIDVADHTRLQHRSDIGRALGTLGEKPVDSIMATDVAALVAELAKTKKRETVRKTLLAIAMVLDFAGVEPNPARDKRTVKLPREAKTEINPPTVDQLLAVHRLLPTRYRLPLVVLDATGMRLGELERMVWGDVDEPRQRWRVSAAVSKTGNARWVNVPEEVFKAVTALVAREDRVPDRRVFQGFGGDRFRTAIARACTAAAVPAFSPHDLRHRRISLLHLSGTPWARIGEHVGQRNLAVTANTYTHVLADETEIDYAEVLA
jgi:integrase